MAGEDYGILGLGEYSNQSCSHLFRMATPDDQSAGAAVHSPGAAASPEPQSEGHDASSHDTAL
jgi:hypothetical protein